MTDYDEFAGLPALEWAHATVAVWHPKCVPFGDKPLHKIDRPAFSLVGIADPHHPNHQEKA